MATLYLLNQKRITDPAKMYLTFDINGKLATQVFEAYLKDFTDETQIRVNKYPGKA